MSRVFLTICPPQPLSVVSIGHPRHSSPTSISHAWRVPRLGRISTTRPTTKHVGSQSKTRHTCSSIVPVATATAVVATNQHPVATALVATSNQWQPATSGIALVAAETTTTGSSNKGAAAYHSTALNHLYFVLIEPSMFFEITSNENCIYAWIL